MPDPWFPNLGPYSIWPLQLGTISWRFGATGLISRGRLTSLLGLLLTGGIALAVGHRRLLTLLSALCAAGAVFLFAGTILRTELEKARCSGAARRSKDAV